MTIVIPKPGLIDRLLRLIGKKRGVIVQVQTMDPSGTQIYFAQKKESALKAMRRPSGKALPEGMSDIFTIQSEEKIHKEERTAQTWMSFTMGRLMLQDLLRSGRGR